MYKFYLWFGGAMLLILTWCHFVGWSSLPTDPQHVTPKTIRDNPGSYRSHYNIFIHYSGGK